MIGSTKVDNGLSQVGTTQLPAPGSAEQFLLFREWIQLCDETHEHDGHVANHATSGTLEGIKGLPTRVVDVGDDTNHYVRLVKSEDMVSPIYLALGHRWGDSPQLHLGKNPTQ